MGLAESAVKKNLARVVVISLAASAIFLLAVSWLGRHVADHSTVLATPWLAALMGIALAAVAVVAMRNLRRMDELARKIHSEAMAFAFLCSILIIAAFTYLKAAGLETPPVHWLLPAMMSCWAVGVLMAFRRYR